MAHRSGTDRLPSGLHAQFPGRSFAKVTKCAVVRLMPSDEQSAELAAATEAFRKGCDVTAST